MVKIEKFLVGLSVGGLMECPDIEIKNIQVLIAENEKDAENKYNLINNCDYFYGKCIGLYNNTSVNLLKRMGKEIDYSKSQ